VIAADIYGEAPQVRRGGWTWYTGAAGWMYRAGTEWLLGIRKAGESLTVDPCIPRHWPGFEASYRFGKTQYEIKVDNPRNVMRGVARLELDGKTLTGGSIPLVDDGATHHVKVTLGQSTP
jgi:cyclic beta-1,2-glucan synthetase